MKGGLAGIFGPYEAAASVYGGYLGLQRPGRTPKNLDEARKQGNPAYAAGKAVLDTTIGLVDDAFFLFGAPLLSRFAPGLQPLRPAIQRAAGVIGFGIAGGMIGRDISDYASARAYLARSQEAVPDTRVNPIVGFNNNGYGANIRTTMTGIASPAAGGIFYRLNHNPFADLINSSLTTGDNRRAEDPVAKALAYGYAGHLIGGLIGSRGGLGRSVALGFAGGLAGGLWGVRDAHNPSLKANLEAIGAVAAVSAPTMALGSLLFASTLNKGRFGQAVRSGLTRSTHQIGRAGNAMINSAENVQKRFGQTALRTAYEGNMLSMKLNKKLASADAWIAGGLTGMSAMTGIGNFGSPRILGAAADLIGKGSLHAADAINFTGALTTFSTHEVLGPMMKHTETQKSTWEQSLALAHLVVFVPHQVALAAIGAHEISKHGTNILAANGGPR